MTDGIQQSRMMGLITPPKLEPSGADPEPYGGLTRSQFLYNQEIRKLTEKAREKGWDGDYFLTRAKHLQDELGMIEYEGAFIEAAQKTGRQLSAMWDESPVGKIQTWWNSEPVPISETRFAAPGKSFKELSPGWTVQSSLEGRKNIKFAGQRFTGEHFLKVYGNDSRIMDYLNGSGGPKDLAIRLDAASAELENFATISDAGVAGWSGYFIANMLLDPTNLLFTGTVVDIVNTARASKRMKKLLDTGQEISPDEARALHRSMTGQSRRGMLIKAATAGVGSVGIESYFDKKVTTGEVLLAGVTSMALAGLIGGIGAMRAKGVSELRGKAREYFDDIMAETTAGADDVPTRIRPDMGADEVQAVLTAEATKRMNRFVREGIEAGRPMEVVAEEAVRGLNSIQQLVGRVSSLTFSDGKTISDLQTSNANTVRTLYAILGNHRLSFKDADAQMIETISDLNAHRGMRITEISSLLRAESSRTGGNGMRGRFHGLVIRALEGRLDATPDEYFTKQKPGSKDPIQMDEMEIDLAKEKARRYADMVREDVFSEYEALAQGTGLRLPIENYFPRTGRVRSKVGEEGQELTLEMQSFTEKYRSYLEDLVEKGEIQPIGDMGADLDAEVTRVVKAIQSGRTQKPGETTFDYRQTDDGQLVRETESPFMETVSETGEMQARTLAGPEGVDIPYDVTEDLYADAADHLMGSMRRHSATTNGAILSAVGAPKGQSLPEYRSTEQPFPATPRPVEGEAPRVDAEDIVEGDPLATQDRFSVTQSEVLYTNSRGQKVVDYIIDSPKNQNIVPDASSRGGTRDASLLNKDGDIIDESYSFVDDAMEGLESEEGFIWRGMNDEEFSLLQKGVVGSRGDLNIGEAQKGLTYFAEDHGAAFSYAGGFGTTKNMPTYTRPSYVVKIKKPNPENIDEAMTYHGEVGVKNFKVDDVVEVYEVRVASETPGTATYTETEPGSGKYKAQGSSTKVSQSYVTKKINFELDPPTPRTPTHTDDLPITSHAEDATINIIPSAKAHKTDNPEKFIEETKPVVREVVEARKARVQNDEELASSNEQLAAKIDEVRTTRTDLDERAKADIDRIANDLRIDSKNASRDLRDWEKSQNNLDRLETKEQTIRDRFDSLRTRTEQRLEELEAKQRKAEEEGFVPKQTSALELAEVSDNIHKLLVRDFKKRGKHSQRVFDRIGKTQKQIGILQAREILLEWKIRGRQYDPEDIGSVLRQDRGLTKSVVDDAQKFLEEHDPKSKILQVFARKDMEPALKTVRSQLLKKNEELVKRNQEYKDLSPEGLTGKEAEELAKLNKRFDEINEFNRSLKGRTPKQYQRNLERMRQEKIDVLKRDLEEWGDPIKDGQLSDKFKVYAKDRVGKYESELEELGELGGEAEGGITHARKLEEEALRRADLSLDRLDSVESEQALNKWLRKNATAANKQEIQAIRDQVKASRLNRNEIRERRKEAGKREREANKVYRQTFDESPVLGKDTSLGDVNGRIAALREEVSMRNMSMGIGRQDGKYVPLNHGYGKAIHDEYEDLIEDARARGKDGLAQKLEAQRDADFQKLGELRDHFLGQSGLDQSSDMVTWGSQFLTSINIAINSLADIAPTLAKSNADMFSGGEAVARSVVSVIRSTVQDALGYGASKNSLGQFFEALDIEGLRTTQASGRASSETSQGSIRLDTEELSRRQVAIRNTTKEVWSWSSVFRIVQPVVRGVAGRLHTTRALELGEKIFKGDVLSEGEQMYVRQMKMSNDELSSAYQNWVRSGGNESVTGSGLRSANTDEWGDPLVGEKFKQGVGNHVEASSLKPRKEDRITTKKGGGVLSGMDANTRFWNNAFNALLSFPRTAFKEYGLKSIQSIAVARQAGDLASHYAMTRNTLTGGAILYGVFQLKKEMRSQMSPWYEEDDSTWGKIKDFGDFLSYTGLFGTILDIPRSGYYASRDFERAKRSVGAGVALGATAIRWVSPSLSGTAKVVGGMFELGETLYRGGINEDDVRRHLSRYGFAPAPVRPSSVLNPLFNALIEEGVEAGVVKEVHKKIVP